MIVLLLIASWVFWLGAGVLIALYATQPDRRQIPEHPTLRTGTTRQRQLRLIHGGEPPYDWANEA